MESQQQQQQQNRERDRGVTHFGLPAVPAEGRPAALLPAG